ncbi:tetratricopeptide repeat protein, partial [Gigaspora margarita]
TCTNKILDIEPNNPYALFCRSEIWFRLEQYNNVLNGLSKLLKIEPDFVSALILRGTAYFNLRKYDKAYEDFRKIFEIEPNNETTVKYLIDAFKGLDFTSISMKHFMIKSFKNFEINNIVAIMLCGEEYFIRGQFDYALLYFNKVLEINPNDKIEPENDIALFYRSEANFKLGRSKESHLNTEKLSKILKIEFNNAFILYNTDNDFKLLQFNKAISDLDVAIKFKPNDMEMLILRGKTYFFLEKYDLALFDFIKALEIEPNNIFILLHINEIFDKPLLLLKNNNAIFINFDIEMYKYNILLHYEKLDETLNAYGNYILGLCYYSGIGVKKNDRKMFNYFYKAATMGFAKGIFKKWVMIMEYLVLDIATKKES